MLLAIFGALAAGLGRPSSWLRDVPLFLEVELGIILVCCILEIVRQKSVRERCVICGSDVETHFWPPLFHRVNGSAASTRDAEKVRSVEFVLT